MTAAGEVVRAARFLVVFVCVSLFHLSWFHTPGQDATGKVCWCLTPPCAHVCAGCLLTVSLSEYTA